MKKLLLFAFLFASFSGFSQTSKGKIVLSGAAGLSVAAQTQTPEYDGETGDDLKITTIQFMPTFGYFIIDNLAVGLMGNISSTAYKNEDGDKQNISTIFIAPTAKYYFMEGKIKPFAQVAVGLSSMTNKYTPKDGDNEKDKFSGLVFGGGGGVAFFLNDNVSIDAGLNYFRSNMKNSDDDKYKEKQGTFSGVIGVSVYF